MGWCGKVALAQRWLQRKSSSISKTLANNDLEDLIKVGEKILNKLQVFKDFKRKREREKKIHK